MLFNVTRNCCTGSYRSQVLTWKLCEIPLQCSNTNQERNHDHSHCPYHLVKKQTEFARWCLMPCDWTKTLKNIGGACVCPFCHIFKSRFEPGRTLEQCCGERTQVCRNDAWWLGDTVLKCVIFVGDWIFSIRKIWHHCCFCWALMKNSLHQERLGCLNAR